MVTPFRAAGFQVRLQSGDLQHVEPSITASALSVNGEAQLPFSPRRGPSHYSEPSERIAEALAPHHSLRAFAIMSADELKLLDKPS
jgi:hypothetical protein